MKITLHQLKVFKTVAEYKSVTKAANHLHMTQPAVSNIIKLLEEIYDCPLIETIGRKLSITAFGQILIEGCKDIQTSLDNTNAKIELLKGGLAGTLYVATVSTAKYFIPHLLGMFKTKFPNIHFKMVVCNRRDIIQRLQDNLDDFVIMSLPPTTFPVECADIFDDELVIAAAKKFPCNAKTTISLSSLKEEYWIIRESGSGTRYATEKLFKKHHFSPKVSMEIGDNESIKQAIIANIGISLISKNSIKLELKNKLIKVLPVKGFPVKHQWYTVKNKGKELSPIAEKFYAFVKEKNIIPALPT